MKRLFAGRGLAATFDTKETVISHYYLGVV
jgi:hypothetical protein